ncbi:MAG: Holliday junction branch migration DNA helicase RuvB [Mycoplasma sp.]|nr:Holliday junction branch migration DNA helicase RuvB [Mycoplasma sp.]
MQNKNPDTFSKFVGQTKIKKTLKVLISSAKIKKEFPPHILFSSRSGLGKTTLANIFARNMNVPIKIVQGPLLEKKIDILTLFASIEGDSILFIDEIHSINKNIEEFLYTVMDEGKIDLIIGPEGEKKIVRMKLPNITIIGATTKISNLSKPLINRFGYVAKFEEYNSKEIQKIILFYSKQKKIDFTSEIIEFISVFCAKTPRKIKNVISRINDFVISDKMIVNKKNIKKIFDILGYYKKGLNIDHIMYLRVLSEKFSNKYSNINLISSLLSFERKYVENQIEPILISEGFIVKNSNGRRITITGLEYMKTYNLL